MRRLAAAAFYLEPTSFVLLVLMQVVSSSPGSEADTPVTGLFKKRYDASPGKNTLGGTCAVGQLLDEGYEQEKHNGL